MKRRKLFNLQIVSFVKQINSNYRSSKGESPGLVVMGGDPCSEGHRFESWDRILEGHFFTYICWKNCNDVCLKRPKINNKKRPLLKR